MQSIFGNYSKKSISYLNMNLSPIKIVSFTFLLFYITGIYAIEDKSYNTEKRIILQEGLSQGRIQCIIEDERGFMWFGTADGLNRYDGYTFKIFRNIFNDSTSLPNNMINSLAEDDNGNIWIGTNDGVVKFNPYTEVFYSHRETDADAIAKGANLISSCVIDKNNNIWCGTDGHGIFKINQNTYKKEYLSINNPNYEQMSEIRTLMIDSKNRLWIGCSINEKIYSYNITSSRFEEHLVTELVNNNGDSFIITFYEDSKQRIWTGITNYNNWDGGLFYLNDSNFIRHENKLEGMPYYLYKYSLNSISSITGDDLGNIWFSTSFSGLFNFKDGSYTTVYYLKSPEKDECINVIYRSTNGILWIGTNGRGIEVSIPNANNFKLMNSTVDNNFAINSIRDFVEDENYYWVCGYSGIAKIKKDFSEIKTIQQLSYYVMANCLNNPNILHIGSEGGGFQKLNKITGEITEIEYLENEPNKKYLTFVYVIFPISDTLVMLGTREGLFSYNPTNSKIKLFPFNRSEPDSKINRAVRTIYKDRNDNILIGYAQGGIGILNLANTYVEDYDKIPNLIKLVSTNPINSMYHDKKERYWIGTDNGLVLFNHLTSEIRFFTEVDGLPNSHIYGILPDDDDNIWLSTNNGISCYYPDEDIFRNYSKSDGLQNNEFNTGAFAKMSNGNLFFGGIDGFNYFNPAEIKQNSITPKVVITGVKISNKYKSIDKDQNLKHHIIIKPDEDVFTIEFAGLSFLNSKNNQYKYKIIELSDEWIDLNNQHHITFNNMSPGIYTVEILASNNHGLWIDKPYSYTIAVLPTFIESIYFKWIILISIIALVFIVYRLRIGQITRQKNNLQLFADKQTSNLLVMNKTLKDEITKHKATTKDLRASNKTKEKFMSIMAHDIINPLGVILGFSDLLNQKDNDFSESDKYSFIQTINITAKGLSSLISNLLQWSRIQNNTINPKPTTITLKNIVVETTNLLAGNLAEKDINLKINIDDKTKVEADSNMLSTIIRNLVSNSIKFTPNNGEICIESKPIKNMIQVKIIDNGVGIPKEKLNLIFNQNETFTTKGTNNESGTGLGLVLVHEFVILNKGEIWIESEVGMGATFCFTLPISN